MPKTKTEPELAVQYIMEAISVIKENLSVIKEGLADARRSDRIIARVLKGATLANEATDAAREGK